MLIRPFKKLVEIHIGMRGNSVAVNFAYIGINRLRQVVGLFKSFKNKMIAHALVGIHSAVQIPEPETDISRCCQCKSAGKINGILKVGAKIPVMHDIGIETMQGQRNLPRCGLSQKQLLFLRQQHSIGGQVHL